MSSDFMLETTGGMSWEFSPMPLPNSGGDRDIEGVGEREI